MIGYFIGFCVNTLEVDGSYQQPVRISLKVKTDGEAKEAFANFMRKHGNDYEGSVYTEKPRLLHVRVVAE